MPTERSKSISVFGWYGHANLGDDLLLRATLRILDDPTNEVTLYGDLDLDAKLYEDKSVRVLSRTAGNVMRDAMSHDAFFVGGGGLFPTKNYRKGLFYLVVSIIYRLRGRKVLYEGLSIESFNYTNSVMRLIVSALIRVSSHFSVRDTALFDSCLPERVKRRVDLVPDLVFSIPSVHIESNRSKRALVCCANIFEKASESVLESFSFEMQQTIAWMTRQGYEVCLLSFSKSDEAVNQRVFDLLDSKKAAERVECFSFEDTSNQCDHLFSSAELSICMRFHALVMSVKAKCLPVSISYSNKNAAFMEDAGLSDLQVRYGTGLNEYLCERVPLSHDALISTIEHLLTNKGRIARQVEKTCQRMTSESVRALSRIRLLLEE